MRTRALLLLGLARSEVRTVAAAVGASPASPFAALRAWAQGQEVFGADLGVHAYGDSLVTWAAQRLVFGPLPPSSEVFVHPVAFAAWLGLLVTTLNLVPLGQLDGGHVLYALLGRRWARIASEGVSAALLAAGIFLSWNWLFWWLLTRLVVGVRHPPALVEEPLPAVWADRDQAVQVLLNLVRNALEAMPQGGTLRVSARAERGGVSLSVADTGPGIAPEDLPRLFEPYFTRKEGGTGLGLAIAQRIAEEHGGRLEVASAPGQGATFTLWLPAVPFDSAPAARGAPRSG